MRHAIAVKILLIFLYSCQVKNDTSTINESENYGGIKDTIIEGVEMVFVPTGPFRSGLHCESDSLNYNYWIGKYEITNKQYYNFLNIALENGSLFLADSTMFYHYDGDRVIPSGDYHVKIWDDRIFLSDGQLLLDSGFADHPVISVTWFGAYAFCEYYGFQLPSEAEWEKAARGNTNRWYPWGNAIDSSYANYIGSCDPYEPYTTPVGFYNGEKHDGFKTNKAESYFGCYDMSGNAWEWTRDPFSPESKYCLGKGGGFNFHQPAFLQVYYVSTFSVAEDRPPLDATHLSDGFRVVKHSQK